MDKRIKRRKPMNVETDFDDMRLSERDNSTSTTDLNPSCFYVLVVPHVMAVLFGQR